MKKIPCVKSVDKSHDILIARILERPHQHIPEHHGILGNHDRRPLTQRLQIVVPAFHFRKLLVDLRVHFRNDRLEVHELHDSLPETHYSHYSGTSPDLRRRLHVLPRYPMNPRHLVHKEPDKKGVDFRDDDTLAVFPQAMSHASRQVDQGNGTPPKRNHTVQVRMSTRHFRDWKQRALDDLSHLCHVDPVMDPAYLKLHDLKLICS